MRRTTLGMAINLWVDRHPIIGFLVFLAVMFALMALCGLDDCGDRIATLGGM